MSKKPVSQRRRNAKRARAERRPRVVRPDRKNIEVAPEFAVEANGELWAPIMLPCSWPGIQVDVPGTVHSVRARQELDVEFRAAERRMKYRVHRNQLEQFEITLWVPVHALGRLMLQGGKEVASR